MKNLIIDQIEQLISQKHEDLKGSYSILKTIREDKRIYNESEYKVSTTEEIIKLDCFLHSSLLDILCSFKSFEMSENEWEKKYYSRNAFLIISETLLTFQNYQGTYNKYIKSNFPDEYLNYKNLSKKIHNFKEENSLGKYLTYVRNKSAGHYDKDFDTFYKTILEINLLSMKTIYTKYINLMTEILIYIRKIGENAKTKMINENSNFILKDFNEKIR